jgi:hypothetical protein
MRSRKDFGLMLNTKKLVGMGVEVGVHTGQYSKEILKTWSGEKLFLVNPWACLDDYYDSYNASDMIMNRRYKIAKKN